uniref:Peptidase S1 domain-containing protein n=1 Tax=Trichuris muris TaxID=70415 RepID=A0A5S6Q4F1_TRIMR
MVVGEFCRDEFKRTHDIALLKLEREVVYNNFIQGICLPPESETSVPSESACFVAGWGLLDNHKVETKLQQIDTHVFNGQINFDDFQENRMLCTGRNRTNSGPRPVRSR